MRNHIIISLILFLFLTTGCQKTSTVVNVFTFQPANYDVKLFTDNTSEKINKLYMDAMLEVKAKYPAEFQGAEEKEENIEDLNLSLSADGPTLLISKNGQTISQLSGKVSKTRIIQELEETITNK